MLHAELKDAHPRLAMLALTDVGFFAQHGGADPVLQGLAGSAEAVIGKVLGTAFCTFGGDALLAVRAMVLHAFPSVPFADTLVARKALDLAVFRANCGSLARFLTL